MGIVALAGIVVLVVLGFGNHVWWLAAVALYLLVRRPSGAVESGREGRPASYQAYRERRDRQARWERRYRRERGRRWF
ncbi:hypothetical protein ACVNF4_13080 [Streptomyces sp. S6]